MIGGGGGRDASLPLHGCSRCGLALRTGSIWVVVFPLESELTDSDCVQLGQAGRMEARGGREQATHRASYFVHSEGTWTSSFHDDAIAASKHAPFGCATTQKLVRSLTVARPRQTKAHASCVGRIMVVLLGCNLRDLRNCYTRPGRHWRHRLHTLCKTHKTWRLW